jgi:hypothetical protein
MKIGMKKPIILAIIALLLSVSITPLYSAEPETSQDTYPVEITSVDETGAATTELLHFTQEEINILQEKIDLIQKLARKDIDLKEIIDMIMNVLNSTNYPILSRILTRVIDTNLFLKGKFVISKGWSRTLNPFSEGEISVTKMISIFRYREDLSLLNIPSTTTIIDPDPFTVNSYSGNHLCFLFNFKGIYIHITKPLPQQSFRYILGMSRFASVLDI